MLTHWMSVVLVLAVLMDPPPAGAQSASELLEKAIYQEKTAGDLDAAIKIYESLIEQEKASRPAVAQAYYRMGLCLAKKGDTAKAANAFQGVIKNYSDQKTLAAAAQKELARLGGPSTQPAGEVTGAEARRLLDPQTRRDIAELEKESGAFGALFRSGREAGQAYQAASEAQKGDLLQKWLSDSRSSDVETRSRAIVTLGSIRARKASPLLIGIIKGQSKDNQFRWLAVRALGQIGDPAAVPTLVDLLDHDNWNTQVAAKVALAEITGVYFGEDKDKWRAWWKQRPAARPASAPGDNRCLLDMETRQAVEHYDQSFASYFGPERAYEAASETERAAMVEKWMVDAKSSEFPRRTRAIAALGNVRAKAALSVLLEIVDEPMGNQRPKWMAIRGLGRIGDPAAVPALIEFVDYGNDNVKVYSRAALADITGVYYGEGKDQWRQWWKQRGANVSASDKLEADRLAAKGWKAWTGQKFDEAEKLFEQSLARDPRVAQTWNGLGWAQFNQGRPMAAKVSFQKALEIDPKHAAALNGMGWIAKGQGKVDEAIGYWTKAVEAQPDGTAALAGLARTFMEQKKYNDAAKAFELWLKAEPNNEEARKGLEVARAGGGKP